MTFYTCYRHYECPDKLLVLFFNINVIKFTSNERISCMDIVEIIVAIAAVTSSYNDQPTGTLHLLYKSWLMQGPGCLLLCGVVKRNFGPG